MSFEAAQRRLILLTGLFVITHGSCIDRFTRHPVTGLAVVPSLTGRPGPHPLERLAQLFPHSWHRIQLIAAPNLPADRNQRREANPTFYQCPYGPGQQLVTTAVGIDHLVEDYHPVLIVIGRGEVDWDPETQWYVRPDESRREPAS